METNNGQLSAELRDAISEEFAKQRKKVWRDKIVMNVLSFLLHLLIASIFGGGNG